MQLTCTAWLESLNTGNNCRGKTQRFCKKLEFLLLHGHLYNGRPLLGVSFMTIIKSCLCTVITM